MGDMPEFVLPKRRYTLWAAVYFLIFIAAPVLAISGGLDLLLWYVLTTHHGYDCYGVSCLF